MERPSGIARAATALTLLGSIAAAAACILTLPGGKVADAFALDAHGHGDAACVQACAVHTSRVIVPAPAPRPSATVDPHAATPGATLGGCRGQDAV
jgi:hypothetical protein